MSQLTFKNQGPWDSNKIFMAQAGSAAYGTKTPESDIDYRGVFLAEPKHIIGLSSVESYTEEKPIDLQCYEFRHYVRLAMRGSPLQLEMLFYPEDVIEYDSIYWQTLRDIRESFLGQHLKSTFGGFAQGDIKRIAANNTAKCGAKGKLLVEKYGYNTKQACNAWRLLRMAAILFTTGQLVVRLPEADRDEIVAIKNGKYEKEEFLKFVETEDKRVFALVENSKLPAKSNFELVEQTVMKTCWKHLQHFM